MDVIGRILIMTGGTGMTEAIDKTEATDMTEIMMKEDNSSAFRLQKYKEEMNGYEHGSKENNEGVFKNTQNSLRETMRENNGRIRGRLEGPSDS